MLTVETTTHIGSDGILRLETPVAIKDHDVRVVLVVQEEPPATSAEKKPGEVRTSVAERLKAAGIISPPKGAWNAVPYEPPDIPGPPISETLVNDRR
jgi:hypothetical protein